MRFLRQYRLLSGVLVLSAITLQSAAWADGVDGLFIGGNFGRARNGFDTNSLDDGYQSEALASGDTLVYTDRSARRLADVWWVDAGYFFTPYVAIDAAFVHAGELNYQNQAKLNVAGSVEEFYSDDEVSTHGPALSVVGRLPLTNWFSVDARLGDYLGKVQTLTAFKAGANSQLSASSKSTSSLLAGVGMAFNSSGHWSVRADYMRINQTGDADTGKFSVDMATIGLALVF